MSTLNWERVRAIMERSIRGTRPNDEEADDLDDAWTQDPDRYRQLHKEVREAAHEEMRRF